MRAPRQREKVKAGKQLLPATHQLPTLPVDKGVTYPPYSVRLPILKMEPGDSFFYPRVKWREITPHIAHYKSRHGMIFAHEYRREGGEWGTRVWRLPDDWEPPTLPLDDDVPLSADARPSTPQHHRTLGEMAGYAKSPLHPGVTLYDPFAGDEGQQ